MSRIPKIKTLDDLCNVIEEVGFLPLFTNELRGFSVMELKRDGWWTGDERTDPWFWRQIIASRGEIAYGKLFGGKAGFVSRAWYPLFANYRRDGFDFDTLYESGGASQRLKRVMDLFETAPALPGYEIKKTAGFGSGGEKGFEGTLTALMMRTYVTISDFRRKVNRTGAEYGWAVNVYSLPETLFGEAHVRSAYHEEPAESREKIFRQILQYNDTAFKEDVYAFIR